MLKKGKLGFVLSLYPILGFIFAAMKMPVLCFVIFALAVFVEHDEWTGRQTLTAATLSLVPTIFSMLNGLLDHISGFPPFLVLGVIVGVVSALVYLGALVFCVLGVLRVMKEQEADLPLFSDLAYYAYGKKRPRPQKPMYGQQPPYYNAPPQGNPPYGYPQQGQPQQGYSVPPQYPYQQPYQAAPQQAPQAAPQQAPQAAPQQVPTEPPTDSEQ